MFFRYIANPNYLEFIYLKGLFLLKNIYIFLHFNCINNNNHNEINSILEKAYIYFIEFLIQININSSNFELTLKEAVMFTYKKTILSYKQTTCTKHIIQDDIDNNLNSVCNIFYIVNNVNFIDCSNSSNTNEEECINNLITNKLNAINTLEAKLINLIDYNINLQELNNELLNMRTYMEKTIETSYDTKCNVIDTNFNTHNLNNIHTLLDNVK
jgi:hypothetical protein